MPKDYFKFKQFTVQQDRCAMKVSTDGVLFGAWVGVEGATRILDIGTGTGVLALIAAQRNPKASIDAVEIDDRAAGQAAENLEMSPWKDRLRVHCIDVRRMHCTTPYDLIISNPPFYENYSTAADAHVGLAKHGDELTFTDLIHAVARLLAPEGRLAVIIPLNRERTLCTLAATQALHPIRRCVVRYVPHRPAKRVLLELARRNGPPTEEELTIEATGPFDYSQAYRQLISGLLPGH